MPAPISSTRFAQVRPDRVRHPFRESWRAVQPRQDFAAMLVRHVDPVRNSILHQRPQRLYAILPGDFLALSIRPPGITDRQFENSRIPFCQLDGDFRLESESVALQRNAFQQVRPDHLVAGFHVRQIQVGDDVRQQTSAVCCPGCAGKTARDGNRWPGTAIRILHPHLPFANSGTIFNRSSG